MTTHRWSRYLSTDERPASQAGERELTDWLPAAGGAALVLLALSSRSRIIGLGALLGGGYLLKRGVDNGTIPSSPEALASAKARLLEVGQSFVAAPRGRDDLDEASRESFPASDPPARY